MRPRYAETIEWQVPIQYPKPPPPPPPPPGFRFRHQLGATENPSFFESPALPKVAMVVSAYHGMRRNRGSIVWGLAWGLAGRLFPLIVPALAFAQGYAEEKRCP